MKSFDPAKIDYSLLFAVIALVIFGVVMVYSTSFYTLIAQNQSPETMLRSGAIFATIGAISMLVLSILDYRFYKKITGLIFAVAVILSIAVLFVGEETRGGLRWLTMPVINVQFMPSEITKFAILFIFAHIIDLAGKNVKKFGNFLLLILILAFFVFITLLQRALSTSALLGILGLVVMFIGGTPVIYILIGMGAAMPGLIYYVMRFPYAFERITIWMSNIADRSYVYSQDKYQIVQSIYAIGTGGLLGKGFGRSELKFLRLPDAYTDFIFAIISEEFGYILVLLLLLTYVFIIGRIFKIAIKAKDTYGFVFASGVGTIIALQVLINVGVVTGVLPTTGVTLPFISRGGTSLIMLMSLVGVVLNISYQNNTSED